jgi:hypothetical protein
VGNEGILTVWGKAGKFARLGYVFNDIWVALTYYRESLSYGFIVL